MTRLNIWFPFYVGDYRLETQGWTHEERGIFVELLCAYWHRQQPLADDDKQLAKLAGVPVARWKKARKVIAPIFTINKGIWTLPRLDEQMIKAHETSEKRRQAGKIGGMKSAAIRQANAVANASHSIQANAQPFKVKVKDRDTNCISPPDGLEDSFEKKIKTFPQKKSDGGKE